jgi:integrase
MRVKKVSIYIRLCGEPGRPFERLKVRNPRQCGKRDYYCLRVAGKWEFFPEDDPARKDLNEALHRKGEREHELRIGVAAPLVPLRTAAQPGKTPVADAVQKYFNNLAAMGKDPKTIRTYRAAVDGFVVSYKKPYIEDYERQDVIDYMGWLRKQPRKERKHANPDRTYFNKVSHVAIFLKACGVRPGLKASEDPRYHEKQVVAHTDEELAVLYREAYEDERFLLDFFIGTMLRDHEAQMARYSDFTGTTLTVHGKQHKTRTVEISQRLAARGFDRAGHDDQDKAHRHIAGRRGSWRVLAGDRCPPPDAYSGCCQIPECDDLAGRNLIAGKNHPFLCAREAPCG